MPSALTIRLGALLLAAGLSAVAPAVLDTFDADNQGWRTCNFSFAAGLANDFAPAGWSPEGGAPGGALLTPDVSDWNFFSAPEAYLGDRSGAFGTDLRFDTFASLEDGVYPGAILTSGSIAVYAVGVPPGTSWTGVSIPLAGASWSLSPEPGGTPISDAMLRAVLSGLDGLYIEADWYVGEDLTGLDNVRLDSAPVPEPPVGLALGPAAAALIWRRRRRAGAVRRR